MPLQFAKARAPRAVRSAPWAGCPPVSDQRDWQRPNVVFHPCDRRTHSHRADAPSAPRRRRSAARPPPSTSRRSPPAAVLGVNPPEPAVEPGLRGVGVVGAMSNVFILLAQASNPAPRFEPPSADSGDCLSSVQRCGDAVVRVGDFGPDGAHRVVRRRPEQERVGPREPHVVDPEIGVKVRVHPPAAVETVADVLCGQATASGVSEDVHYELHGGSFRCWRVSALKGRTTGGAETHRSLSASRICACASVQIQPGRPARWCVGTQSMVGAPISPPAQI